MIEKEEIKDDLLNQEDINHKNAKSTSRRTVVKRVVGLGIGAYLASKFIRNEITTALDGEIDKIDTSEGVFIPLYERHDKGIDARNIPDDLDIIFREVVFPEGTFASLPSRVAHTQLRAYKGTRHEVTNAPLFRKGVLDNLAEHNGQVMIGDISTLSVQDHELIVKSEALLGAAAGTLAILLHLYERDIKLYPGRKESLHRRSLIKYATATTAFWGLSPSFARFLNFNTLTADAPLRRIGARLEGIISDFHPEDMLIFFRNALIANKLLIVANNRQQLLGKKPRVGMIIEGGHSGVEDFLRLGDFLCKEIILLYPRELLEHLVQKNGGIEDFCSARLLQFPPNVESMDDVQINLQTKESRVSDTVLIEKLRDKLNLENNNKLT